jgi:5-methylcytosine-specific restriction endonuclease McrA
MARRRKKSKTKRSTDHRTPPRPATWDSPRGHCRFCGEAIIENDKQNMRKRWHEPCAKDWVLINQFAEARKAVFLRERGKCQADGCEFTSLTLKGFQVDHIKPLFENIHGDLDYWRLKNLQLLCVEHHKIKTKADMVKFRASKDLND